MRRPSSDHKQHIVFRVGKETHGVFISGPLTHVKTRGGVCRLFTESSRGRVAIRRGRLSGNHIDYRRKQSEYTLASPKTHSSQRNRVQEAPGTKITVNPSVITSYCSTNHIRQSTIVLRRTIGFRRSDAKQGKGGAYCSRREVRIG
jgi:hypothetical protein